MLTSHDLLLCPFCSMYAHFPCPFALRCRSSMLTSHALLLFAVVLVCSLLMPFCSAILAPTLRQARFRPPPHALTPPPDRPLMGTTESQPALPPASTRHHSTASHREPPPARRRWPTRPARRAPPDTPRPTRPARRAPPDGCGPGRPFDAANDTPRDTDNGTPRDTDNDTPKAP